jgi:NADPH-dependent glutamate synthase beta subunit-like oxidoreductase
MKIHIDNKPVEAPEGMSVMDAAATVGIRIPSMCYLPRHFNHPSCMVCLVKDEKTGNLFPSCAMPVSEGMQIITNSADVHEARKEALELLLSDHVGDCEASCRRSCPAFMDIPLMNRLIATGRFEQALKVVREEIALPVTLGYICPAPCEKACYRAPLGGAVSICLLKRSAAIYGELSERSKRNPEERSDEGTPGSVEIGEYGEYGEKKWGGKKVAVIGTGPAGLSAAYYLLLNGHQCVFFDKNELPGGALRYGIPRDHLPKDMLDRDIDVIRTMGAEFRMNSRITRDYFENEIMPFFDAVVLATGNREYQPVEEFGFETGTDTWMIDHKRHMTSRPGVFVCGNIIHAQKMAVRSAAQGKAAAVAVQAFLEDKGFQEERSAFHSVIRHITLQEREEYLKESIPGSRTEPGGGFIAGLTKEEAMQEAMRCLHCDCRKPVSCKLRILSEEYHVDRKRFASHDRKKLFRSVQHDFVVYEPEKCIKCGICIEISKKEKTMLGLTFIGRGFDVKVGVPFSQTAREALEITARECAAACPTGALAVKNLEERLPE